MYIYIRIYIRICIYIYTHAYIYTCIYIHVILKNQLYSHVSWRIDKNFYLYAWDKVFTNFASTNFAKRAAPEILKRQLNFDFEVYASWLMGMSLCNLCQVCRATKSSPMFTEILKSQLGTQFTKYNDCSAEFWEFLAQPLPSLPHNKSCDNAQNADFGWKRPTGVTRCIVDAI